MEAIKARMIADGIHWPFVNIGVVQLSADEEKSRKVFEFAKKWGIDARWSPEPPLDSWDTVIKCCKAIFLNKSCAKQRFHSLQISFTNSACKI